jgi:hypothetical protein
MGAVSTLVSVNMAGARFELVWPDPVAGRLQRLERFSCCRSAKINAGHSRYHVDEVGDPVDAAEPIGDGVDEYYADPSVEAAGGWFGGGARELGLRGDVGGDSLRRALDGLDHDGRPLRDSSRRVRVTGYDLTFSAFKSVRVLLPWAIPSCRTRSAALTVVLSWRRPGIWIARPRSCDAGTTARPRNPPAACWPRCSGIAPCGSGTRNSIPMS